MAKAKSENDPSKSGVDPSTLTPEIPMTDEEQRAAQEQLAAASLRAEGVALKQELESIVMRPPGGRVRVRAEPSADEMVTVYVPKAFKLCDDEGRIEDIGPGKQQMSKARAEHWYVKANGVKPTE